MRKILTALLCSIVFVAGINYRAIADYAATAGSGLLFRAFDATHGGTSLCAAASTQCHGVVLIDSAGTEKATSGNPVSVSAIGVAQGSTTAAQTGTLDMGAVTTSAPSYTTAQTSPLSLDVHGGLRLGGAGYPAGAIPETISATGTTTSTTATLATAASTTTYICGFSIRANATAVATNNATVTGTITGTLNFTQWTAANASGLGVTEMIFSPCIPASGANQAIAVVSGAPGTGGVVSVTAWGFQL